MLLDGVARNIKINQNSAFHVIPCNEWYNFKPMRTYQTLSLEEAEAKVFPL